MAGALVISSLVIVSLIVWLRIIWYDCGWWRREAYRLDGEWTARYRSLAGQFMDADEVNAAVDAAVKRVHAHE